MTSNPARWHADPTGRHELRYWDGRAWTEHVSDRGVASRDPLATSPAPGSAAHPMPSSEGRSVPADHEPMSVAPASEPRRTQSSSTWGRVSEGRGRAPKPIITEAGLPATTKVLLAAIVVTLAIGAIVVAVIATGR